MQRILFWKGERRRGKGWEQEVTWSYNNWIASKKQIVLKTQRFYNAIVIL